MKQIRIGIDVGGTFTHAVAIDNQTLNIIASVVTSTTHNAKEGVALGIIKAFHLLLEKITDESKIIFIAHSTTQATNALLEGDVSAVGILGIGKGMEGLRVKGEINLPHLEITKGKFLKTSFEFYNLTNNWDENEVQNLILSLKTKGAQSIVTAQAFSVDDPQGEKNAVILAQNLGFPACGTHEISGLYGLRIRTRTAVINASILPKMNETANLTQNCIQKAQIDAPLMIMRSDGGVMTIEEMRRRPLLTLLSGPAAGIAAALTYIQASDAIFLEVGGTSTDISVIKNGRAVIKSAQIGGHHTYLKTLDSRTLGIAGGSLIQIEDKKIKTIGPRSAHIAGLKYISFSAPEELKNLEITLIKPKEGDPTYLALKNEYGLFAITSTCAANFLNYIPEGSYAYGNQESLKITFNLLSNYFKKEAKEIAQIILEKTYEIIIPVLNTLIKDYNLKDKNVLLIGGGGGAWSIVPGLARKLNFTFEIAKDAPIISAIGAALALIRETIERNVFQIQEKDILNIHREAEESVIKMGAQPESVEVQIEIEAQKNLLRAIATGSIEFKAQDLLIKSISEEERKKIAAENLKIPLDKIKLSGNTNYLFVYQGEIISNSFLNLIKKKRQFTQILDQKGTIRLQIYNCKVFNTKGEKALQDLENFLKTNLHYGDAGASILRIYILYGKKILDFSTLISYEQVLALAKIELKFAKPEEPIVILGQI